MSFKESMTIRCCTDWLRRILTPSTHPKECVFQIEFLTILICLIIEPFVLIFQGNLCMIILHRLNTSEDVGLGYTYGDFNLHALGRGRCSSFVNTTEGISFVSFGGLDRVTNLNDELLTTNLKTSRKHLSALSTIHAQVPIGYVCQFSSSNIVKKE